jgi:outer membrane protein insertion porin family
MPRSLDSRYVTSSLVMAIAVTSPLAFTQRSWAQTLDEFTQPNRVLYYGWQNDGWQTQAEFYNAESSSTVLEIADIAPVGTEVTFDSGSDSTDHSSNDFTPPEPTDPPTDLIPSTHPSASLLVPDLTESTASSANPTRLNNSLPSAIAQDSLPESLDSPNSEPVEVEEGIIEEVLEEEEIEEAVREGRPIDGIAPVGAGQTIADIEVRFLDKDGDVEDGHARPSIYLREFDLEPGTVYDEAEAQQGLNRIVRMPIVRFADVVLEPAAEPDQVTMVVLVQERRTPIVIDLASVSPSPSALEGPFQQNPVLGRGPAQTTGLSAVGSVRFLNLGGNDQSLSIQLEGGETVFNSELSFVDPWIGNDPTGIAFNIFNQRSVQRVFAEGNRDVDLPNKNTPWVHRWGGGVEVFRPVAEDWELALGVNYQQVSIHNSAFETERFDRDELGERLVVSDDDFDDLLTVQFSGEFNQIEYLEDTILAAPLFDLPPEPIEGPRFRFGVDQAIPVGDASIAFTRLSANYLHYLPLDLFGFTEGPRTLVLNAQTGFMFGDIPPYEAFGPDAWPLDSYASSGLASGSRFALAVAEYRFPIVNFRLIRRDIELGGALFSGFTSTLGSADEVIGDPSVSRQKPEDGFVGGVGLRARTAFGLFRVEVSINDDGDAQLVITGGGKF